MSDLVTMPMGTSRSLTTGMRWHLCFSIMPATEATVARWRQVRGGLDIVEKTGPDPLGDDPFVPW